MVGTQHSATTAFDAGLAALDALDPASRTILARLSTVAPRNLNGVAVRNGIVAIALGSVPQDRCGKVVVLDVIRSGDKA